jgi:hypothetical protein
MITTVTCCKDLLEMGDTDFIALLRCWENDKRCPLPLGDLLRERGLESAGRAADWANTYRDRKMFGKGYDCGPYPMKTGKGFFWHWDGFDPTDYDKIAIYCDSLPEEARNAGIRTYLTVPDALCAFLDAWV